MKYDLRDRTVAITGGGGGLGMALADLLQRRGANVAAIDIAAPGTAASSLARVSHWTADVRDLTNLTETMSDISAQFGGIDVVIAAAGVGQPYGPLDTTAESDWERAVDINLNGVWRTFRAAAPHVIAQKGHILAIASVASFMHSPLHPAYTASKAAVWALCNSLRLELRQYGVTVGSAHPAFFKSPLLDEALADPSARQLWSGFKGAFALSQVEKVAEDIVRGVERRSRRIASPRHLAAIGSAPHLAQYAIETLKFSRPRVSKAIGYTSEPEHHPRR